MGVDSGAMRIAVEYWQELDRYLSTAEAGPPTAVTLLIHALAANSDIEDGYAVSKSDNSSTIWRNWVITKTSLIYTEIQFGAENYDARTEDWDLQGNPNHYIEPDVREAWVRRLDTVTSLTIGSVGRLRGNVRKDWYPVDDLSLTFADGARVDLPGQTSVPVNDRQVSDRFLATLRSRLPV